MINAFETEGPYSRLWKALSLWCKSFRKVIFACSRNWHERWNIQKWTLPTTKNFSYYHPGTFRTSDVYSKQWIPAVQKIFKQNENWHSTFVLMNKTKKTILSICILRSSNWTHTRSSKWESFRSEMKELQKAMRRPTGTHIHAQNVLSQVSSNNTATRATLPQTNNWSQYILKIC